MVCGNCHHEWCWICGFEDFNGENAPRKEGKVNYHDFITIQCNLFGLLTELPWYGSIPLGLIGLVLVPVIVFFLSMMLMIGIFCDENKHSNKAVMQIMFFKKGHSKYKLWFNMLAIILWILYILFCLLMTVLFIIIFIIPIYISIVFVFFRMIYWWNKKRRIEIAQKNA